MCLQDPSQEGCSLHITYAHNFDIYEELNISEDLSKKVKILCIDKYEFLMKTLENILYLKPQFFPKVISIDNLSLITLINQNRLNSLSFKESLFKLDRLFNILSLLYKSGKSYNEDFK